MGGLRVRTSRLEVSALCAALRRLGLPDSPVSPRISLGTQSLTRNWSSVQSGDFVFLPNEKANSALAAHPLRTPRLKYNIEVVCEYIVKKILVPPRDFTSGPPLIVIRSFDINKPGCEVDDLKGV
ncbi:hypothetical protein QTO34_005588 [Cnephaeus nilssonii]|uniref:Uncharacterized protein n=1 Tax=Cnephaeus nilssonii TaxID=3371016 RepID=A0AA40HPP3_CNENI|nr:hypothetical protein QTO34_005588 [Eptesicus nilssonii]